MSDINDAFMEAMNAFARRGFDVPQAIQFSDKTTRALRLDGEKSSWVFEEPHSLKTTYRGVRIIPPFQEIP